MIIWAVLVFAAIAWINLPPLIQKKDKRALAVYAVTFLLIFAYVALYALGIEIPNTIVALHHFFEEVLGLSYGRFRGG